MTNGLMYSSKKSLGLTVLIVIILMTIISCSKTRSYDCKSLINGFVPNEETAINIAKAICIPIIGEESCYKKEFKAVLIDGKIWKVSGDSHVEKGGMITIEIQKIDSKVINVEIEK